MYPRNCRVWLLAGVMLALVVPANGQTLAVPLAEVTADATTIVPVAASDAPMDTPEGRRGIIRSIRELRQMGVSLKSLRKAGVSLARAGEDVTKQTLAEEWFATEATEDAVSNPKFDIDRFIELIEKLIPLIMRLIELFSGLSDTGPSISAVDALSPSEGICRECVPCISP